MDISPGVTRRDRASRVGLQCTPSKMLKSGGLGMLQVDIEKRAWACSKPAPAAEPLCSSQCDSQPHPRGYQETGIASIDILQHNTSHQHQMLSHQTNVRLWWWGTFRHLQTFWPRPFNSRPASKGTWLWIPVMVRWLLLVWESLFNPSAMSMQHSSKRKPTLGPSAVGRGQGGTLVMTITCHDQQMDFHLNSPGIQIILYWLGESRHENNCWKPWRYFLSLLSLLTQTELGLFVIGRQILLIQIREHVITYYRALQTEDTWSTVAKIHRMVAYILFCCIMSMASQWEQSLTVNCILKCTTELEREMNLV